MKKKLTGVCAVLLAVAMGVSMTACGGKTKDTSKTDAEPTTAAQTTEEPTTEAKGGVGSVYHYKNVNLKVVDITDDPSKFETQYEDPEGKYVMAEFEITDGKMTSDEMSEWKKGVEMNDVEAKRATGLGGELDEETFQLTITGVQVYFDMPVDTVVEDVELTVEEV